MKVALIVPLSPFLFKPLTFPPLGPLYISAYLKAHGYEVSVYVDSEPHATKRLEAFRKVAEADIIGITGTTPQLKEMDGWAYLVKSKFRNKTLVAGGPHASCDPKSCLEAGFNYVVIGDGEQAFLEILKHGSPSPIVSAPFKDLDSLPFPDREAIDIKRYKYKIDGLEATSMITTRGCPFQCAFCCHWPGYRMVRFRSPEKVVEEVNHVRTNYGYEAFMFWDDEFNLNRKRTFKLCEALKPLNIKFRCFIRADLFDRKLGEAMEGAGCVEVGCGVESGSQRILNNIHKGTTVHQNSEARRICKELDIRFKAFLILGLPGENLESVNATREWVRRNEPDDFDVTIFTPYPGSPIWEKPELYNIRFNKDAMRENFYSQSFYKGPPKSWVSTKSLSANELVRHRDQIEDEFNRKIRSRWLWEQRGGACQQVFGNT